jgi:hypothetical protein
MKNKYVILCLIIVQLSIVTYGQKGYLPGYIIDNNSDTLRGIIKLQSDNKNSLSCDFIEDLNQSPHMYTPEQIKGYRINNRKYYVSKEITIDSVKRKVFLEYLVAGIVDLYYMKDKTRELYFIQKDTVLSPLTNEGSYVTSNSSGDNRDENESTFYNNSNQYKRVLKYLFRESPSTVKEINYTNFAYKPLIKITKDYHNSICHDNKCIDYTKSTDRGIYVEPYAGVINSWMGLKNSKDLTYNIMPYYGVQLRFKPFKGYSMWNILVGANYSTNNYLGDYDYKIAYGMVTYRIYSKYSIIRVPVTVDYSLSDNKLQPFISFSFNNIILTKTDYSVNRVDNGFNTSIDTNFRKYQAGALLGVGLKYNLNKNTYIYLKNEFEYRMPVSDFGWVLDHQRIYSDLLSFGLGYKIK